MDVLANVYSVIETCSWITAILVITLTVAIYKFFTRKFDYWKNKNVPYVPPVPFFGNFKDVATLKTSITDWHRKMYNITDEPYAGVFFFDEPFLMVKSPQLLKQIIIKDFDHFRDKSVYTPDHDELQANLLFWQPSVLGWKTARSKMTPFFSSGKLKLMFPSLKGVAGDLKKYIYENTKDNPIEAKEVFTKYSTDGIAKCAFGIQANSLKNHNAEFREVGRKMFQFTFRNAMSQISYFYFHTLARLFRMSFYGEQNLKFMANVIETVIKEREKSGLKGNDLIDLLVQIKKENLKEFEGDKLYSPPINLFIGGFETTGTTVSMVFYELAMNKHVQDKVRKEILETSEKHDGITFDALKSMKYLDQCIKEGLRKYPTVPFLDRLCVNDYQIPGTDFVIEKGTPIYIPMMGFHYDEEYFPEPEKFIPERFDDMSKINNNDGIFYFPFGDGPRACIGKRFGELNSKLAVATILAEFEVEPTERTPEKIKIEKKSLVFQSEGGIILRFKRLKE